MSVLLWVAAGLSCLLLGTALLNVVGWPRGRAAGPRGLRRVAVLIPARDEAETITDCVSAAHRGTLRPQRVVVCDDGSADGTGQLAATAGADVIAGQPLRPGWVGKPHACQQLGEHVVIPSSDQEPPLVLAFVDADVTLSGDGLARLVSILETHNADVVSAVPRQTMGTWFERLVMPMLHVTYAWLPMPLVWASRDPRFLAANGQLLAMRASAWRQLGGFSQVRAEVVDDMALCRLAKQSGLRVVFADGHAMASCRMYTSAAQVWRGFSKNLYEGIGGHPVALVAVLALYGLTFVLPWVVLPLALAGMAAPLMPAVLGVGAGLALRLVMVWRHGHPLWSAFAHPVAALAVMGIAVNSFLWSRQGAIRWRGRVYAPRAQRVGSVGAEGSA